MALTLAQAQEMYECAEAAGVQFAQALSTQPLGDRLFVDAILKDVPVSPNFYDGLQVQAVIDAAQRSHQHGQWVELE